MTEQATLSFGGLLRQLRAEAQLTQEELAEAAQLSPRSVSDLERGISRTARKDTAELLAGALGLAGPVRELFVAAARGRGPAGDVLAAREGRTPGADHRAAQRPPACPYRGLLPFRESDAEVFYGRERLAAELAAKLAARAASGGLVVVTGASGAGKSSLLRAGLLPLLARGQQVPGSDRWPRIVMTPTKDPLTELAARLAAVGGPDALAVREGLARHPGQAHLAIRSAVLAASARRDERPPASDDGIARLVLIVDQFEQVFTLNPDVGGEATRQAFITALCSAAANPAGPGQVPPALVVLAVRGDFCDRCAAFPELAGALQDGLFVVVPMTESELRVAITGPAEAAGLRIDPALTEAVLGDLRVAGRNRSAGVLPLLSQAMALTWEHREGDRLTSRGYARAGGVSHAVQTGADRAYDALPAGQQAIAREVLRAMTVASRDGGLARRPVTRGDLYDGLPGAARGDIDAVLDAFAAERLAILDGDSAQLSHDVLLRAWPRLHGWLEQDQASWIVHGQLADAAAAWRDSREDPSFLYRGTQLVALQQAVTQWSADPARSPALTSTQRGFLQASDRARRSAVRWRRAAVAGLLALTLAAITTAAVAARNAADATRLAAIALSRQLAVESLAIDPRDPVTARQLAVAAWRVFPTDQANSVMATLLTEEQRNGILPADPSGVNGVAFSPDGKLLASADNDGTVRLWAPATGQAVRTIQDTTAGSVNGVAFSPDGKLLASADNGGTVRLWAPATGQPIRTIRADTTTFFVAAVTFSPDGKLLASSGVDGRVRLWDPATGQPVRTIQAERSGSPSTVKEVAFSPDGKLLASADDDGTVRLWDPATGQLVRTIEANTTGLVLGVSAVAFSPDGKLLASADDSGTVRLWDPATGHPARTIPVGTTKALMGGVAFSPDGKLLASVYLDARVRLWDPATGQPVRTIQADTTGPLSIVTGVAFSPDGKLLASADNDGTVRLWDPATGQPARTIQADTTGRFPGVAGVAFSPDGKLLASADNGGTVRLWDPATGQPARTIQADTTGRFPGVAGVAFSPDGKLLASAGYGIPVRLWDPATGQLVRTIRADTFSGVNGVAFSPDGKLLAGAEGDGTVRLWDPATGQPVRTIQADTAGPTPGVQPTVHGVAFSPDGKLLASADNDGTVRLWDPATGQAVSTIQADTATPFPVVKGVAFSPDGKLLASADHDGTVRLWGVSLFTHSYEALCADVGPPTQQDWHQYAPGEPQPKVCA
jgi:WD40 repeat protein/transcriptional regulator with XRE-family HTH domain